MELVDFARGPALQVALVVFFAGVAWRLVNLVLQRYRRDFNEPRHSVADAMLGGLKATAMRSWPHPEFIPRTGAGEAMGYGFHIGLFIVVVAFAPHIAFFGSFLGFKWPHLPSGVVTIASVLTLALLFAILFRRVTHPVLRMLSNFDDYFTLFVAALVLVTGLMATAHFGAPYQTLLGLHILSFDLFLIWFPFGKLMHAFYIVPSRFLNGTLLSRKGATS